MSLFKCKMCGGTIEISNGATVAECEYCGNLQTVPKSMDDNMQNLCNRANTLRIKGEFDKAAQIYEKIIQHDSTQSEAYWGLILCKYGIEYVDDPATLTKIPTCHRASYDSIIADDDYKSALENADITQKAVYENQAKEIDRIQKDILALSQKEEKYDVFICYKETDANGKRTQDSVIANDIYYQLTNEGFKVFYAAITLEGKLGSAYEPIIFAALNSAKVMLVIGTNPDYFNAVWVKNEWSRFLKIIQKDRSKLLIPCYRDMDAYELPEEFAHLQAQDMSKIGFINDIVRGIKKVIVKDEPKTVATINETVVQNSNINIAPLLKRAFMFLEDGEWNSAEEYCEKVLDQEPENSEAYLCELLIEFKCKTKDELSSLSSNIKNSKNYAKILRFGTDEQITYVKAADNSYQAYLKAMQEKELEEKRKQEERRLKDLEEKKICDELFNEYLSVLEAEKRNKIIKESINETLTVLTTKLESLNTLKIHWDEIELKIAQTTKEINEIDSKITQLNTEKNGLGIFAGKRKKEIDAIISDHHKKKSFKERALPVIIAEKKGYQSFNDVCRDIEKLESQINDEKKRLDDLLNQRNSETIHEELSAYEYGKFLVASTGDHITFGSYPQTKVTDNDLINTLNNKAGALPTSKNPQAWTSYKYYIEGQISDYMWYIDVDQDDEKYRGVYFTEYRPYFTTYKSMEDKSYQSKTNNYNLYTIYWFKYEPILWTILSKKNQAAFVCCNKLIDSQQFNYGENYNNNYTDSTIRMWLNQIFYDIAFNRQQKQRILTTMVDNSISTTGYDSTPYICSNTQDKVFLLSYKDVTNSGYGFSADEKTNDKARQKCPTDYAQIQGADNSDGYNMWWLRSPCNGNNYQFTRDIYYLGNANHSSRVDRTGNGIAPAMWITF